MTGQIVISMIGGFRLLARGETMRVPPSAERVVAYLAVRDGPASRSQVAGNLWIDLPEERAMANLRSALWRLHQPGIKVVDTHGERLCLSADAEVDLHQLKEAAAAVLVGRLPADQVSVERLADAGELLDDWWEDWVLIERERFRQLRLQALERVATELAASGDYARATTTALAAVVSEPLRESAQRALISIHLAQGNRAEAIRQYCLYRRLMRDELGLEPSQQMETLVGPVPSALINRFEGVLTKR